MGSAPPAASAWGQDDAGAAQATAPATPFAEPQASHWSGEPGSFSEPPPPFEASVAEAPLAEAAPTESPRSEPVTAASAPGEPEPSAAETGWAGSLADTVPVGDLAESAAAGGSAMGNGASGGGSGSRGALLSPVVRRLISEHGLDPAQIPGTGMGGRITREDVLRYLDARAAAAPVEEVPAPAPSPTDVPAPVTPQPGVAEPFASPAPVDEAPAAPPAPTAAEEHAYTAGSEPVAAAQAGPESAASGQAEFPPPEQPVRSTSVAPTAAASPPAATSPAPVEERRLPAPAVAPGLPARDEVIPFSTIRRVTAEHMVRSKQTAAHTLVSNEVDFENVDRLRKALKDRFKQEEGVSLTYLPFIARAVIDVLRSYPHLNASVADNTLVVHHDLHLGIAVDLDREGLMVPVIHHADGQSLRGLARSIADLAARARSRKLTLEDISGGTFTITNPGPFGTLMTYPIIAQPQVAILSTDGVRRRPVVVTLPDGTETIGIHSVGILALAFDHRAVDGAYAAAFLHDVSQVIETRDWQAELASGTNWA